MPKREQVAKPAPKKTETVEEPQPKKTGEELKAEMDAMLDEIDAVLEENAEEFVRSYVQKGGEGWIPLTGIALSAGNVSAQPVDSVRMLVFIVVAIVLRVLSQKMFARKFQTR